MLYKVFIRTVKLNDKGESVNHDVCIISTEDKQIAHESAVLNIHQGQQLRIEAEHVIAAIEVHDTVFWLHKAPEAKYFYPPKPTENPTAACGLRIPAAYAA